MGEFNALEEAIDDCLPELEEALVTNNKVQAERLVAYITRNKVIVLDMEIFRRWRGIAQGYFMGNLKDDVDETLTGLM